ncbi:nucleoside hydrolase [Furfurilactobacillus rossiae]|uniref:Inosine-uridine preferring nucleoside hydrolase n=1 Tax=Furfurilactobacillus rossiae DSM 15814 TaxID=1114972 RepID=A0A0R1R9C0_9LACO|nr:nucleoside hydrolase [Furfurilactobacillus rossiae]KRL53289.1 inosine-uridine preferring nucleoside hydrolase [Furfurilactobacillus rossiae DSM 15814]QFR66802.1 nucleoside hydrolase [Furfurilactobacillus rossiae]QLE62288.1 Inosine-uridine preferring nucleoside hydrolase [Furfurilactobacillus rossiae]
MATKKMILDLDTGVDDALAIAYAVASPEVDLIGIVSSYGNVLVDKSAENSLDLLELLGATDVPVFLGESHSSTTDHFDVMEISQKIHGVNGIGEVKVPKAKRAVESEGAVDFIIDAAHKYGDNLILVPTGPQTNLDAAITKDPEIAKLIGNMTFMGGALTVPGNVTAFTEANINQDPAAADRVFRSPLKSTMVGLDVTLRTLLTKKETQQWRDLGTVAGEKYADITDYYIDAYYNLDIDKNGCAIHDPLAVGVAIDPSYAKLIDLNMKVTHDDPANPADVGRTIGDTARLNDPTTNMKVAVDVDKDRYLAHFMDLLTNLFAKH